MNSIQIIILVSSCILAVESEVCSNPQIQSSSSYTPTDASALTHIAFIAEFTIKCSNKNDVNPRLYASANGALLPAVQSATEPGRYQVSWTVEIKSAKSGNYPVKIYDEEGYSAMKRVMMDGSLDEADSTVKPIGTVVVSYPGAFNGHYINSELLATCLSAIIFYVAYTSKNVLLA